MKKKITKIMRKYFSSITLAENVSFLLSLLRDQTEWESSDFSLFE